MLHVSYKVYSAVSAFIFTLVAFLHLFRLIGNWKLVIADWSAPMWVSAVGLIVAGYLAFEGFHFAMPMRHEQDSNMPPM